MNVTGISRSRMSRRAALAMTGGAAAGVALTQRGIAIARQAAPKAAPHEVFFGWVLGSTDIIAVAIDASESDAAGDRVIKAYVCDGLGFPEGVALWFKGTFSPGSILTITLPGSEEVLTIDCLRTELAAGMFTSKSGETHRFASYRAIDGAGIYDVTLNEQLQYSGTSTDGSILDAQADQEGSVSGTITTADGREIAFSVHVLALFDESYLAAHGLPPTIKEYAGVSVIPDSYVAVIAPAGSFWLGRSGDVRGGKPGTNIIDLDQMD